VPEFFRVKKLSRIDVIIFDSLSPQTPFLETRFGLFLLLFWVFLLPQLMPHNVLYDTSMGRTVKPQLADSKALVKASYPQAGGLKVTLHVRASPTENLSS
jgi:hypothetical protein